MTTIEFKPASEIPDDSRTVLIYYRVAEGRHKGALCSDLGTYVRPLTILAHDDLFDDYVALNPSDGKHYCCAGWYRCFANEHGEDIVMPNDVVELWADIPMPEAKP
jgi:hypothetical protein